MTQNEIFVGRDELQKTVLTYLKLLSSPNEDKPKLIVFHGAGGIGKTKLLNRIRERVLNELGYDATDVLDLRAITNRSSILLLKNISDSVSYDRNSSSFTPFHIALYKYNDAKAQEKYALYDQLITTFLSCCREKAKEKPFLIILDTFETIQDIQLSEWILEVIIKNLEGPVGILLAGRKEIGISNIQSIRLPVGILSLNEIDELARKLFDAREIGQDYDLNQNTIKRLAYLTDGTPILVTLAIEWLIEKADVERMLRLEKQDFEPELVKYLKNTTRYGNLFDENFSTEERLIIRVMATIDKRFDSVILSMLTNWELEKCRGLCNKIKRFSFIKSLKHGDNNEAYISLHDEMLRLVQMYANYPNDVVKKYQEDVVRNYYDRQILEINDPQQKQALIAEKLHYQLRYDPQGGIEFFDGLMSKAIDNYEFEFCDLLLSEVVSSEVELNIRYQNIIELNRAEILVKKYKPFEAKPIFDKLVLTFSAEEETEYLSRAMNGLGACIANGATVIEINLTEAISLWKKSLDVCKAKGLEEQVASISYQLGYGYDLLGQHEEAIQYYGESCERARRLGNLKLVAKTLDEMGRLRRKRYEVLEALNLFKESITIKEQMNDTKSMGVSFHYMGDAFRDLDNFPEALKWYALAEKARQDVSDDYGLCVLYGDIGWLYLLDKNWEKAIEYTDKSYYDYAIPRHFGREMAEMEHSYYHIELEVNGLNAALPWIEKAFVNAEIYSNTFIYLDAALHIIEAAHEQGEYSKIPFYYEKMEELDKKGCGYRMFKGRAVNILGDINFIRKNFGEALAHWQLGYTIIAIHGRSRSSVLNFDDHLLKRENDLIIALVHSGLDTINSFKLHWTNTFLDEGKPSTLQEEYPAMGGICDIAQADYAFLLNDYYAAIKNWFAGFVNIAKHIARREKGSVISLNELVFDRDSNISCAINSVDKTIIQTVCQQVFDAERTLLSDNESKRFIDAMAEVIEAFKFNYNPL